MRLLLTADAVGGVWQYSLDLARALVPHGVETVLAVMGPGVSAAQRAEAGAVPALRLIETGLPLDWLAETPGEVRAAGAALARLAGEVGADLVQLHAPALALSFVREPKSSFVPSENEGCSTAAPAPLVSTRDGREGSAPSQTPVIAAIHSDVGTWWTAVRGGRLPEDFRWRADLVRDGLRASALVVAPSAAFAAAVAATYGVRPRAVRNGRAVLPLRERPQADAAFTCGRLWDAAKDLVTFDGAAALSPVPFRAAGPSEGPNGERIRLRHAEALGLLSEDALGAELAARPIFVSTAHYEPFGLAVLEAAQAGCALVLSDIPTFRELWDGAALFVPAGDAAAVAGAVDGLIADSGARARAGQAARDQARRYTPEATAAEMMAIYRELTARPLERAA